MSFCRIIKPYRLFLPDTLRERYGTERSFQNKVKTRAFIKEAQTIDPTFNPSLSYVPKYEDTCSGKLYYSKWEYWEDQQQAEDFRKRYEEERAARLASLPPEPEHTGRLVCSEAYLAGLGSDAARAAAIARCEDHNDTQRTDPSEDAPRSTLHDPPVPMQKTQINPEIIQPFLESAANAAAKGQGQYFTPLDWGRALAAALPHYRPVIMDLSCGAGHLLHAAARPSTVHLLGCDIDPCPLVNDIGQPSQLSGIKRVIADNAQFYPLMCAVDLHADLWVLNAGWDLHQYREPMAALATSEDPAVAAAFKAHDGRCGRDTIDSTVASMCIALDRSTVYGEGFIIANESTLQRLILAPNAPHRALASHCWAHLVIEGNICSDAPRSDAQPFCTGVLYFARAHEQGLPPAASTLYQPPALITSLAEAQIVCNTLHKHRLNLRPGPEVKSYARSENAVNAWEAAAEESNRLTQVASLKRHDLYNLWLDAAGVIRVNLSLFDRASGRVSKSEADALFHLDGQHPMQLVMQRTQRRYLEQACGIAPSPRGEGRVRGNSPGALDSRLQTLDSPSPWRVDPALAEAVHQAVRDYAAVRAPLYPLSPIQRLGYLDEQDKITCRKDLFAPSPRGEGRVRGNGPTQSTPDSRPETAPVCFRADESYAITSSTVAVRRYGQKVNLSGEMDDVEWDGAELAFFITDASGVERVFMEGRLRSQDVRVSILDIDAGERPGKQDEDNIQLCPIDFTLHELVDHFVIPEVPDVATVDPVTYQAHLNLLKEIEQLTEQVA